MFKSSFSQLLTLANHFERTLRKIAQSDEDFDFLDWTRKNRLEDSDLDNFDLETLPYDDGSFGEPDLEDEFIEDDFTDEDDDRYDELEFSPAEIRKRQMRSELTPEERKSLWNDDNLFEDEEDF